MKKIQFFSLLMAGTMLAGTFTACSDNEEDTPLEVKVTTVTNISPTTVAQGEDITVTGENLDLTTAVTLGTTALTKKDGATEVTFKVAVPADFAEGATTLTITWEGGSKTESITVTKTDNGGDVPLPPCTSDEGYFTIACFEDVKLGAELTMVNKQGNEINEATSAFVEENPAGEGQVAKIATGNYDEVLSVAVTLPAGKTLGSYDRLFFDLYRNAADANYKEMHIYINDEQVFKTSYIEQAPASAWTAKDYDVTGWSSDLLALSTFTLAVGISSDGGDYYLDNIVLREDTREWSDVRTCETTTGYFLLDCFNALARNTDYAGYSKWGVANATVVANPTVAAENAILFTTGNYDDFVLVHAVLPEGKTVANYSDFEFALYYAAYDEAKQINNYGKNIFVKLSQSAFARGEDAYDFENASDLTQATAPDDASGAWVTVTLPVPTTTELTATGTEIYAVLGIRGGGDSKGGFYINNVRLKEK